MAESERPIDDALVEALIDAFDDQPVPADLTRFAVDALRWRVIDDELATLTYDSDTADLVGVRGITSQRQSVRFEGRGLAVSLAVTGSLADTRIAASIEPPGVYHYVLEGPDLAASGSSDVDGYVEIDQCTLPLRFVVETEFGRLVGPWLTG